MSWRIYGLFQTTKTRLNSPPLYDHIFEYSIRPRLASKQHLDTLGIEHRQ